jgi:hypothetical protein
MTSLEDQLGQETEDEIARAFDKPVGYYIQGDDELRQWKPSVLSFGYSFANVDV